MVLEGRKCLQRKAFAAIYTNWKGDLPLAHSRDLSQFDVKICSGLPTGVRPSRTDHPTPVFEQGTLGRARLSIVN